MGISILQNTDETPPLESLLGQRFAFIELAFASIVLALGINLAAARITATLSPFAVLIIALVLIVTGTFLFIWKLLLVRYRAITVKGTFACNEEDKRPVEIRGYLFGTEMAQILDSAFAENEALEKQWQDGGPGGLCFGPNTDSEEARADRKASKLTREAAEYFLLESLSTTLTDHFHHSDRTNDRTIVLTRKQIPEVLLANRFLNLFSTPMEDRPAFIEKKGEHYDYPEYAATVYSVFAKSKGRLVNFRHFDLVLPKNSRVTRTQEGDIVISTPRLELRMKVRYDGFGALVPPLFAERYLQTTWEHIDARSVAFDIEVKVKLIGLLSRNWADYRWIDSFLVRFENSVEFDEYLNQINWNATEVLLECLDQKQKSADESTKQSDGTDDGTPVIQLL